MPITKDLAWIAKMQAPGKSNSNSSWGSTCKSKWLSLVYNKVLCILRNPLSVTAVWEAPEIWEGRGCPLSCSQSRKEMAKCMSIVIPCAKYSDRREHRSRSKASPRDYQGTGTLAHVGVYQAEEETWRDAVGKRIDVRGKLNITQCPTNGASNTRGRKGSSGQGPRS